MTFVVMINATKSTKYYINPEKVESVHEYAPNLSYITMSSGEHYNVSGDANTIASMLCAEPSTQHKFVSYKDYGIE